MRGVWFSPTQDMVKFACYAIGNASLFSKQPGNFLTNSCLFMPGFVLGLLLREYAGITVESNAPNSLVTVNNHGQFHSIIATFVNNY
jgi:hypothetical protein